MLGTSGGHPKPGLGACAAAADDADVLPAGLVALALGNEVAAVEAGVAAGVTAGGGDVALASVAGAAEAPSAVALAGELLGAGVGAGGDRGLTPGEAAAVGVGLTPGEVPAADVGVGLTAGEAPAVGVGVGLTPGEVALPVSLPAARPAAAAAAAASEAVPLVPAGDGLSIGDVAFLATDAAVAFLSVAAGFGDSAAGDGD